MVIKGNKGILFIDLTKTTAIRTYTYYGDKKIEFVVWNNNTNEYSTYTLAVISDTDFEKAIDGLFMAIQRGAKTIDLDKYVRE